MIRFFKGTFISRPVFLVLLFLAIRVPLLIWGVPVTLPELKGMVLGERLNDGFAMYRDSFDNTGPLTALVYWFIDLLDGRSAFLYRFLAAFLLLLQAFNLNLVFNRFQVQPEKTYLPALFYLLGGSFFFELDMLMPILLGHTFIMFALPYLIVVSKEGSDNRKLFKGGFMIGLAALCYLPFGFFLIVAYFSVVFFAANTFRSFLLLLCGFAFPFAFVGTYYLYNGALDNFIRFYIFGSGLFQLDFLIPPLQLLQLLALPLLVLVAGILASASSAMGLNYQQRMQQLFLIWTVTAIILTLASPAISGSCFVYFLPPLAYYGYFLFRGNMRPLLSEAGFLLLSVLFLVIRFAEPLKLNTYFVINTEKLKLQENAKYRKIVNGQLLVLGPDFQYYAYNYAASPYLNWDIAEAELGGLSSYDAVFALRENMVKELPAFIVDEVHLMPKLQYHLPLVFGLYEPAGASNLYKLRRK